MALRSPRHSGYFALEYILGVLCDMNLRLKKIYISVDKKAIYALLHYRVV